MRKARLLVAAAVLALTAIGAYSATAVSADDDGDGARTLRLEERNLVETVLNLGEQELGVGTQFIETGDVYDDDNERVGTAAAVCTLVLNRPESADAECQATLKLKNGQIAAQGLVRVLFADQFRPFRIAIVGGTGRYRDADGEARVEPHPDGTSDLTVRLT
jgi:hypothetical protein